MKMLLIVLSKIFNNILDMLKNETEKFLKICLDN